MKLRGIRQGKMGWKDGVWLVKKGIVGEIG